MKPSVRKTVRLLLLNEASELLLMCIEDFDISTRDGKKNKRFWCTIGGGVENGESLEQAAGREIYEETGIAPHDILLGPAVWHSCVELILKGKPTILDETFFVAKVKSSKVALHKPTIDELKVVKKLEWFSFEAIKNSSEVIFPEKLHIYLPAILAGHYPKHMVSI